MSNSILYSCTNTNQTHFLVFSVTTLLKKKPKQNKTKQKNSQVHNYEPRNALVTVLIKETKCFLTGPLAQQGQLYGIL